MRHESPSHSSPTETTRPDLPKVNQLRFEREKIRLVLGFLKENPGQLSNPEAVQSRIEKWAEDQNLALDNGSDQVDFESLWSWLNILDKKFHEFLKMNFIPYKDAGKTCDKQIIEYSIPPLSGIKSMMAPVKAHRKPLDDLKKAK